MSNKVFYSITQDPTGALINYSGARYFADDEIDNVRYLLAKDYNVPDDAINIDSIVTIETVKGKL